jgi:orotidine-5'-phosphate decarboxylase
MDAANLPFADRLVRGVRERGTPCIIGLDPDLEKVPESFLAEHGVTAEASLAERAEAAYALCVLVLDAVADLVSTVKPQAAYFERFGAAGVRALERTCAEARRRGLLVLLDAKRGDIGSTAAAYAEAYLSATPPRDGEADALTVNPYLGLDSLEPFVDVASRDRKGLFVLAKTSNPGSGDFQDRLIDGRPLYVHVAERLAGACARTMGAEGYGGVGVVVGGTYPEPARLLRSKLPHSFFLVPGFGAQGADPSHVSAYFNADGLGALVSSSRAVMYPHRFGAPDASRESIRAAAVAFVDQIGTALGRQRT